MLTFYLVRHGTKEAIPFDPPLTRIGLKQAEVTADYLKAISFIKVIASPKLRTQQTAKEIAKQQSLPIYTDERLLERMEWQENETFEEFIAEWNKTDIDRSYFPRTGMSSSANGKQARKLLDELSNQHEEGNILVVTHGGTIGDILRNLFTEEKINHATEPKSDAKYIDLLECSITTIKSGSGNYELLMLGDISHLSIPLI